MEVVQITSFKDYLIKKKYSLKTVRMYAECLKCLDEGIPNDKDELFIYLSSTKLKQKKVLSKPKFNNFRAAIHLLFTMTTGLTVKEYLKASYIQDCNFKETLMNSFFEYLINFKHVKVTTGRSECYYVRKFIDSIGISSYDDFSNLTAYSVKNYIETIESHLKHSSKGKSVASIRNLFRFVEYKQIEIHASILTLPLRTATWKNGRLPIILNNDEELSLRLHYKENNERDTRNKLIILFQLDLGLRASEVASLSFNDIRWNNGSVIIRNAKNAHCREIPITAQIGSLLEKYILSYRRKATSEHLFLSLNPRKMNCGIDTEEVRRVIRFAMKKENITGYLKGTHALRRTAASHLYNSNIGLKLTADILGHESLDSTVHYVKVDFDSMRSITTVWPGGDSNDCIK